MAERRVRLSDRMQILEKAIWRKWNKFTWSGLFLIGVGFVLIAIGLVLNTGAYSAEGLLIGIGAIIILIGIVRILIGFINPLAPSDLAPPEPAQVEESLDSALAREARENP